MNAPVLQKVTSEPDPISAADHEALKVLAQEMEDDLFTDFQCLRNICAADHAVSRLRALCATGDEKRNKAVKKRLATLLVRSWSEQARTLRLGLGLHDFMSLWEVSERFSDAFMISTSNNSRNRFVPHEVSMGLETEIIIERQLEEVARHPDFLRTMAQADLQRLCADYWVENAFSGLIRLEREFALRARTQLTRIMAFALSSIPNAEGIIAISVTAGNSRSAGNVFCNPEWEPSNIETWFTMVCARSSVADSNRKARPSSDVALNSVNTLLLSCLVTLVPVNTLITVLREPWQWQFAYEITGHKALVEKMPASQRESALAFDLGL